MKTDFIVLDFETTGIHAKTNEILQVACIDSCGDVILNAYCRPELRTSWVDAERIHGITPEMVADKPTFSEYKAQLQAAIDKVDYIIAYNAAYEYSYLVAYGFNLAGKKFIDPMLMFAPVFGEWNEYHGNYRWQKLTTCAEYYGYNFTKAHDALADVQATLYVFKKMFAESIDLVQVA